MVLLVRDEDVPTVAGAVKAFAEEEGLEPVETTSGPDDPLAVLALLGGPRVLVAEGEGLVAVFGLESLDVAEIEEWGAAISTACTTEVLTLEVAEDGVRMAVYDDGEHEETIEVPLDGSGRTRAPALAELTDSEDGRAQLAAGLAAKTSEELAAAVLRCFGVSEENADGVVLSFVDPLDDDDANEEPRLDVQPVASMSPAGGFAQTFAVTLHGADAAEGLRLELSGDVSVDAITLVHRRRGSRERITRDVQPATAIELRDAYLERIDVAPPEMDLGDMFGAMQRLVSAGEEQQLNTLIVSVTGARRGATEPTLTLTARALTPEIAAGEATVILDAGVTRPQR